MVERDQNRGRRQMEIMAGVLMILGGLTLSLLLVIEGNAGLITNAVIMGIGMLILFRVGYSSVGGADNRLESNSPARWGAYAGIVVGLVAFGYGLSRIFIASPPSATYSLAFVVTGFLNVMLCLYALTRSRIAWAFAVSLNGTAALIFLFGIPQVRAGLGVENIVAVLPCAVFAAITTLLIGGSDQY